MASRWGSDLCCDICGLTYRAMRTGDTFASIQLEMRSSSEDPKDWRYRRRHSVLGYWHAKKKLWWRYHLALCADTAQDPSHEGSVYRGHARGVTQEMGHPDLWATGPA